MNVYQKYQVCTTSSQSELTVKTNLLPSDIINIQEIIYENWQQSKLPELPNAINEDVSQHICKTDKPSNNTENSNK